MSIGIDYGLGMSNVDKETGIRFGVISQNSVDLDCWSDAEPDYGDAHCPECGARAIQSDDSSVADADWNDGKDFACAECQICFWSESAFPDEPVGYSYDEDGYHLTDCLDTDIMVLASPYYTFAQFCSPCVPGAGNLDHPMPDGAKTYCLGHDWFEDGKAPYPVYSVETGELVKES